MKAPFSAPEWASHKGWFGFCPVFVLKNGENTDNWRVEPRSPIVAWLVPVSLWAWKLGRRLGRMTPFPIRIRSIS